MGIVEREFVTKRVEYFLILYFFYYYLVGHNQTGVGRTAKGDGGTLITSVILGEVRRGSESSIVVT